ncbi:MAG: CocE/NonD family hydrolase C-terminal non-catalytic domain-containing protein [Candidatus Dormibacteria bacterium]
MPMPSVRRLRVLAALSLAAAAMALIASPPAARAAAASTGAAAPPLQQAAPRGARCPAGLSAGPAVSPAGGRPFVVCTGRIRSFDGTPLETDVTIPLGRPAKHLPLMIFLHGWGNSKTEWESTTLAGDGAGQYHWNNAWFAAQGYVVLNYTARGFHRSCGKDASGYIYLSDPSCINTPGEASWTHLADRRWETHDSQYLAGLLVDDGLVSPSRIVASGGSYGGGQSWDLALSQDQVVASASTDPAHPILLPWTSPRGTPMHLAAAAPMYPWTDLADALVQNGRAADGFHAGPADGDHHLPYGVDKQSYVSGLFADGAATAQYSLPGADPSADLTTWNAAINAGEPYGANPLAAAALTQVGGAFRSPLAMPVPVGAHEVPVYVIQGQTDPLFPAFQALDMVNHLRAVDPSWPVTVFLGDVGHSYADNPKDIWQQAHDASNAWLAAVMARSNPSNPAVTVTTTACMAGQTHATYTAASYGSIAGSVLHLGSATAQTTTSSSAPTVEGVMTDPIANSGCRTMPASQSDPNQAVYSFAAPPGVLVGAPSVSVDVAVTGASAEVAARLWEIDASGNQTLITRTVYRLEEATATSNDHLHFELWPQAWQFQAGDTLKLELTQDDSPVWRPDNEPSSLTFTNLDLALPLVAP